MNNPYDSYDGGDVNGSNPRTATCEKCGDVASADNQVAEFGGDHVDWYGLHLCQICQESVELQLEEEGDDDDDYGDSMDGDDASALSSAGFGTDEDYGSASDLI